MSDPNHPTREDGRLDNDPNTNAEGGGTNNIQGGDLPPGFRDRNQPQKDEFVLNVNGKTVTVSRDQAAVELQKRMAGDERLRVAAEKEKETQADRAFRDDFVAATQGDEDAFRRAMASANIAPDQIDAMVDQWFTDGPTDGDEDGLADDDEDVVDAFQSGRTRQSAAPSRVGYDNLSPDIQRVLRETERERVQKIVKEGLDKDDVVRYNMGRLSDKNRAKVQELVDEKVRGRLNAGSGDFGDGSHILREVVPEIRDLFEALGSPERTHGQMSLGNSPDGGMQPGVHPSRPPEYVSSQEDVAFDQHILETIAHHQSEIARSRS